MKIIQKLSDMIEDEIADAGKYAKCAMKHKDDNRGLADVFYTLSTEEMRHMEILHGEVVKIIEQYRREKCEPPADMLAVYNYLHERQIAKAGEVKAMQAMYKGA